jgi:hypothetical protein
MSGSINSSNNSGVEMNIDDIEIDVEELNTEETISKIMNEIKDSKKRRYPSENNESEPKVLKESSNSPNRAATSELSQLVATSIKSSHRTTKIEPVIFFKVHEKPVKNLIEKYLMDPVKDVNIIEFKITANNNVLVYTNSNDDNIKQH